MSPTTLAVEDPSIDKDVLDNHIIVPSHIADITTEHGELQLQPPPAEAPPVHVTPHGPAASFNGQGFCATLHAALKDCVIGYVMQMHQHGSLIYTLQWNWAKTPVDGGVGWNPQIPMHVASLSKMITGIAMTKVLDANNISYDASILPYLPEYWVKGPNMGTVTFRQLMTHTSGFTSSGADFLSVKAQVAAGVKLPKVPQYENSNFSLCRVLLPVLLGNIKAGANFGASNDNTWDLVTRDGYRIYVGTHIFDQTGTTGLLTSEPGDALAYNNPSTGPGWNSGDLSSVSGAAGWHFSVAELLKLMGSFRRGSTIMSPQHAQQTLDNMFGIDWKVARPVDGAFIYSKNGLWENGGGQVEQGVAFYLPEDMELVVFVNSPIKATTSFLETVVLNAYTSNVT